MMSVHERETTIPPTMAQIWVKKCKNGTRSSLNVTCNTKSKDYFVTKFEIKKVADL